MRSFALSTWLRLAAPLAAPLVLVTSANTVFAQTAPQVSSQVSETEVEVGEAFTVELKAMAETAETVSDPDLRPPAGFSISGPMISQQSYMQFGSGGRKFLQGIGATWSLVGSTPGTFNIPAPSIVWNGQRLRGSPATIKVVPQGSKPQRQQGFLFPGGMPGGGIFGPNGPFGGQSRDSDVDDLPEDEKLNLPRAPKNDVFLHAIADKTSAVVGEQVTISVYRYFTRGAYWDVNDSTPMRLEAFLRHPLLDDQGVRRTVYSARAGGKQFFVGLVDRYAAFPLHTGTLATGTFMEKYVAWNRRTTFRRASEDLTIAVKEPPLDNRPVGYRIGDVGQFQISALVQPRRVEEGGSVAVTVRVTGSGNFPTALHVPEKTGVEWLDPEKKENIEIKNGELSGVRSFGYVVRLAQKGTVNLGVLELPYWNPRARRYEVARTALGTVDVVPGKNASPAPSAAPAPTKDEPFATLPQVRTQLSPFTQPAPHQTLLEGPRFTAALVFPPAVVLTGIGASALITRTRRRMADRKSSPRTLAAAALADAKQAKKAGDERAVAAAVERAIVLAIEARTGVKARGILKEALSAELAESGVNESVATRAQDLLAACDRARFDPHAAADVDMGDAAALVSDLLQAKGP